MSKRSRGQREIERLNRDRLAMGKQDPNMIPFPEGCSDPGCNRPAAIAVTFRKARGQYQGWSGCTIHVPKLTAIFQSLEAHYEAVQAAPKSSGLAIQAERSEEHAVSVESSVMPTNGPESEGTLSLAGVDRSGE